MIRVSAEPKFENWRQEARKLLAADVPPSEVYWEMGSGQSELGGLAGYSPIPEASSPRVFPVPPAFIKQARLVSCHREDSRWELLYRILFRLREHGPNLLTDAADPDIRALSLMAKSVSRDIHKMHAFVRFKEVMEDGQPKYLAWHRPDHFILEEGAQFFVRRFGDRPWSIFTDYASAHWDGLRLGFGEGMPQHAFTARDAMDETWLTYYKSIFNPARIHWNAMMKEFPERHWRTLPESAAISELLRDSSARVQLMAKAQKPRAEVPANASLPELAQAAAGCTACPLYERATQTVFGRGPEKAEIMIIGEQPGDEEDLQGQPFVGPSGQLLRELLDLAQIEIETAYVTNAVKHFKWTPGDRPSKPRIHKTASPTEAHACKPWLEAEIARVKPKVILALGRTAGFSVCGRLVKVQEERGKPLAGLPWNAEVVLSWHPSALLRASAEEFEQMRVEMISDLQLARNLSRR